jgi:hypothetical protein
MDVSGEIHAAAVVPSPPPTTTPPEEGTPFYVRLKGGPETCRSILSVLMCILE